MTSPFNKGLFNGLVCDDNEDDDNDDDEDNNYNEKDDDNDELEPESEKKEGNTETAKLNTVDDKVEETIDVSSSSSVENERGARHLRHHALANGFSEDTILSVSEYGTSNCYRQNNKSNSPETRLREDFRQQSDSHIPKTAGQHKINEIESSSQNFISEPKSFQNFDRIPGYDETRWKNGNVLLNNGSTKEVKPGDDNDEKPESCFVVPVGKINNGDRRGLISKMEDFDDYVDKSAISEQPENPSNDGDVAGIRDDNPPSADRVVGIGEMEKLSGEGRTFENKDDKNVNVYDEFKDRVDNGGDMAAAFDDVTKMCLAPLSELQGYNPGHVFYGNDDDNEDNNRNDDKYYDPLKAAIAPVRIHSLDKEKTIDASAGNDAGPSEYQKQSSDSMSGGPQESVKTGKCDVPTDIDYIRKPGVRIGDENNVLTSNFGDFPEEPPGNTREQAGENFNENSKQNDDTKPDNLAVGDESQISGSSSSVPVPFSQALNYRRRMQCPITLEQEAEPVESVGAGHESKEGHDDLDGSILMERGTDLTCENDKTLSCALKTAVTTASVTYRDNQEEDSPHQQSAAIDHVGSELPNNQTRTLVSAEIPEHASERRENSKDNVKSSSSKQAHARNEPHIAAKMASAEGLSNFSLTGVLPFAEQKRLVSEEYEATAMELAFEDFNLAQFNDEDTDDQDRRNALKKKLKDVEYEDRKSANIRVVDPSDVLVVDIVDKGHRRRSVAESAQDWLVDWTEQKGKNEWIRPLHARREMYRHKVLTQNTVKASGFVILKNTKRKRVQQLQNWWDNVTYTLALWGKSIRRIEGVHGSGVASYFLFLRWLFGLNIVLFAFMVSFTTIPMAILDEDALEPSTDTTINTSYYCSEAYVVEKGSGVVAALEFIQGTGWMEKTYLFYGHYVHALQATYNLPLAYMLAVLACLIISLVLMARYTGKSFRDALLNAANTNFEYSNKVFGAWDYGLTDLNAAEQKQKGIHDDIQGDMLEQSFMRKRIERLEQRCSRCKLYTLRLIINFFILVFLGAAAYLIYFVTSWSTEYAEENKDATGTDAWLLLLVQYLPSLTITICNVVLPLLFEKVVVLEDYSQAFVIQITLIRTVFLRLASLIVLVISLYSEISCTPKDSCNANTGSDCTELKCWETYVGQQFYKLAIMDFLVAVIKVFLVELPRRLASSKCNCGLIKALGPPEFNIPANVLDLVYGQCLVWLGFLFCPLLPGLNIAKLFIFFYVKKLSALVACPPTDRPYKASRTNIFFMVILLVAFSLCALPVMYSIFAIEPSKGCGPFLLFTSMNQALERAVDTWPSALNITYDFLTSAAVTTIVIIFLAVAVYYLRSIGKAHKQQAALYREQLIMEGRDKQFLMSKLQEMYMPGQKGKQPDKDNKQKKTSKKDTENVAMIDERGGYSSNNPPGNPYSPPNAPVDNRGGDW